MEDFLIIARENVFILILELSFGAAGALIVSRFAHRFGFIDAPSERSSHVLPTPKGGGIGILSAFVLGCFVFELDALFCLSVTFLSLLSLIGDRIHLSPSVRLIVQFAAAFLVVFSLSDSLFLTSDHSLFMLVVGGILAAVFIVGTANFYNFMDGINGIAGITGVVGFGLLAGYGASCGKDYNYLMLSFGLALACLGFLPFNVPRAKVFMGDVGSILLGFVFAVIVINFAESLTEFVVLSSFLFPFYADELVTMAERVSIRQSLTTPHRRHLYQILANEAGIAHWKVSFGYGFFQLIVGLFVWKVSWFGLGPLVGCLVFISFLFLFLNHHVKKKEGVSKEIRQER